LVIGESGMFSLSIRIDAISLHIRKDFVSSTDRYSRKSVFS